MIRTLIAMRRLKKTFFLQEFKDELKVIMETTLMPNVKKLQTSYNADANDLLSNLSKRKQGWNLNFFNWLSFYCYGDQEKNDGRRRTHSVWWNITQVKNHRKITYSKMQRVSGSHKTAGTEKNFDESYSTK